MYEEEYSRCREEVTKSDEEYIQKTRKLEKAIEDINFLRNRARVEMETIIYEAKYSARKLCSNYHSQRLENKMMDIYEDFNYNAIREINKIEGQLEELIRQRRQEIF